MDLDAWPYPAKPLVPLAETVHERFSVEIFRGCTRGCRFCQAGMITRPVRERSIETIGDMVENGIRKSGFEEVGLLSLSSADHSEIARGRQGAGRPLRGLQRLAVAARRRGSTPSTSPSPTSSPATAAAPGLTFAPEGGSERMRKVINKMVTEEDLIRTVATAYGNGWRQVKLYFMCGLPTETDEDVLAIADLAKQVIAKGREVSGRNDIRCTVSIGGFVPKPHTPFQWAAQLDHDTTDERLRKLRERGPRRQEVRPRDRLPLPRRQARHHRGTALPRRPPGRRGDRAGVARRRPVRRLERALLLRPLGRGLRARRSVDVDLDWYTTRERDYDEVLPWDHLDSGLDKDWLWADWEDALAVADGSSDVEVEDCRWTPCYDCGVCPEMDTEIQIGPTGRQLLPLSVV